MDNDGDDLDILDITNDYQINPLLHKTSTDAETDKLFDECYADDEKACNSTCPIVDQIQYCEYQCRNFASEQGPTCRRVAKWKLTLSTDILHPRLLQRTKHLYFCTHHHKKAIEFSSIRENQQQVCHAFYDDKTYSYMEKTNQSCINAAACRIPIGNDVYLYFCKDHQPQVKWEQSVPTDTTQYSPVRLPLIGVVALHEESIISTALASLPDTFLLLCIYKKDIKRNFDLEITQKGFEPMELPAHIPSCESTQCPVSCPNTQTSRFETKPFAWPLLHNQKVYYTSRLYVKGSKSKLIIQSKPMDPYILWKAERQQNFVPEFRLTKSEWNSLNQEDKKFYEDKATEQSKKTYKVYLYNYVNKGFGDKEERIKCQCDTCPQQVGTRKSLRRYDDTKNTNIISTESLRIAIENTFKASLKDDISTVLTHVNEYSVVAQPVSKKPEQKQDFQVTDKLYVQTSAGHVFKICPTAKMRLIDVTYFFH